MSSRQGAWTTLTRRTALTQVAAGGIAAIGLGIGSAAAQDATSEPGDERRGARRLSRVAGELRSELVPAIVAVHTQSDEELVASVKDYLDQLKEDRSITEEEASSLQQIVDIARSDADARTKIDQIKEISDKMAEEEDKASPIAVAIAGIAVAIVRRAEPSTSDETATPGAEAEDAGFWDRVKEGLVGALAGAVIGKAVAGEEGAVIGAIAGGLAGST
ncbi:MAG: YMGG-like glycine zipper-containing protein [Thermomicrobiales bacterium]